MWLRLGAAAILLLAAGTPSRGGEPARPAEADVIVLGGTPSGIAAAVAAARMGSTVLLLEPTSHVGGIVSNGLTNADIINRQAVAGLFFEFTQRVLDHYRRTYGPESEEVKLCRGGYWFEPHVAENVFLEMLREQGDRVRLVFRHRLKEAIRQGDRVVGVVMEDLDHGNRPVPFRGRMFIDATYEGDLAARAGVECRVGREGRDEHGEPLAGRIYAYFGSSELLPGSTGEADQGIQAYCFRIFVTRDPDRFVPIPKPEAYDPADYDLLLEDIGSGRVENVGDAIQLLPVPNGKWEVNSNHVTSPERGPSESLDLAEENWGYPEADYGEREKFFRRLWSYSQGLLWFLANDPRVPQPMRDQMRSYGFSKDEFTDNDYRPRQLYVREARRIVGRYVLTQNDGAIGPLGRTQVQPGSIAVVEYPWDSHGVHKYDGLHPGVREGYFYVRHAPIQVPYGVILPRRIGRLAVPVCCSASHVGYQAIRMEPVYMALGQAAGVAAHLALAKGVELHEVPVEDLQIALVEQGAVVTHYDDLPFDHPAFAALQFLGARGLNPSYQATPELKLSRKHGWVKLGRILESMGIEWTPPNDRPDDPLRGRDVAEWLGQVGWPAPDKVAGPLLDSELNLAQFAQLVYEAHKASRHGR
jgi:hypothetical protein